MQFRFQPDHVALLVHDLQGVFMMGPYAPRNSEDYVRKIKGLVDFCRSRKIPVIYTKACFRRDGADIGLLGEFFEALKRKEILIDDQEASEILGELAPEKTDIVIRKGNSYSAFHHTALEDILRNLGVNTLVMVGGATNVGLDSLARDALSRGFQAVLLEDATFSLDLPDMGWGAMSQDQVQKAFLSNFAFCLGQVMKSEDFKSRVG